jgi:hypothetical protein
MTQRIGSGLMQEAMPDQQGTQRSHSLPAPAQDAPLPTVPTPYCI